MTRQTRIRTLSASGNTTRALPKFLVSTRAVSVFIESLFSTIKGVFNGAENPEPQAEAEDRNIDEMTKPFDEALTTVINKVRTIVENADSNELSSIADSKHKDAAISAAETAINTLVSGDEVTERQTVATEKRVSDEVTVREAVDTQTKNILSVILETPKAQHWGLIRQYQSLTQFEQSLSQSKSDDDPELPSKISITERINEISSQCSEDSASIPGFLQRFLKPRFDVDKFASEVRAYYKEVKEVKIAACVTEIQTKVLNQVQSMLKPLKTETVKFENRMKDLKTHAHEQNRNFSGYDKARGDVQGASEALAGEALEDHGLIDAVYTFVFNQDVEVETAAIVWHIQNEMQKIYDRCIPELMDKYTAPLNTVQAKRESAPYVEVSSDYANYRLEFNGDLFQYHISQVGDHQEVDNRAKKNTDIPNIRAIYSMEIGFTMNDLRVFPHLERAYKKITDMGEKVHIHKDANLFTQASIDRFASEKNGDVASEKNGDVKAYAEATGQLKEARDTEIHRRHAAGETQRKIAEALGIGQATVNRVINSKHDNGWHGFSKAR